MSQALQSKYLPNITQNTLKVTPVQASKCDQLKNMRAGRAIFVYGSLRPDDDSGQAWTKAACQGMDWIKAEVPDAALFKDTYASAVLGKKGKKVIGCILSCGDDEDWLEKLEQYDRIEGYDKNRKQEENLYQRKKVVAKIAGSGEKVEVLMYHRPSANQSEEVPNGDWLQRVR